MYGKRRESSRFDGSIFHEDGQVAKYDVADNAVIRICDQGHQNMSFVSQPIYQPGLRRAPKYICYQFPNSGYIGIGFGPYNQDSMIRSKQRALPNTP
ncbi:MAG: hypothetical protein WCB99_11880 [Candidatus Cybelea sp.]